MSNTTNFLVKMQDKNHEYAIYISIIFIWLTSSYLYYQNYVINTDFDIYNSFALSLLMPILILFLTSFVIFCFYSYVSIGFDCIEKIGTDEPWDFVETMWFFSMLLDD